MSAELKDFSFQGFAAPNSPNWYLAAPPGGGVSAAHGEAPVFAANLADLRKEFFEVASAEPRVALVADGSDGRRYRFIQKTRVFKFVDEITVEFVDIGAERTSLFMLSRSRTGWWDLGVNRRRVLRWLAALEERIGARSPG